MTWADAARFLSSQWKFQTRLRVMLTISIVVAVALAGALSLAASHLFRIAEEEAPRPVIVMESGSGFTDAELGAVQDIAGQDAEVSQYSEFSFQQVDETAVRTYSLVAVQDRGRGLDWVYPTKLEGDQLEGTSGEPEVVLGGRLHDELFSGHAPGDLIQISGLDPFPNGERLLTHFRLVGITEGEERVAFILHSRISSVVGSVVPPSAISISYDTPFISFTTLTTDLEAVLPDADISDNRDDVGRGLRSATGEDPIIMRDWAVGVGLFIWILVPVLISSVGWQLVASRRSQWAVFMAVGHSSGDVRRLLGLEVLILGFLGLIVGWIVAAVAVGLASGSWPISGFVGFYLVFTFVIPVIPAVFVAWRYPLPKHELAQALGGGL